MKNRLLLLLWLMLASALPIAAYAMATVSSTALEASHVLKSSAGNLFGFQANATTVGGWVMLFDAASAPADGTVAPLKWWQVPAGATLSVSWPVTAPLTFANGIVLVFSTTGPFTKTGSATATFSGEVQ